MLPDLSEDDVRALVGPRSFERGYRYFLDGAVFDARLQEMRLKAYCEGSQPQPYRVQVTFDSKGIIESHCSCPVGEDGDCKHIAALLLTWIHRRDEFREIEDPDAVLGRMSRDELIALVRRMLAQRPELEALLVSPLKGRRHMPVKPDVYRSRAAAIFRRADYGWDVEEAIANDLKDILDAGSGFLAQEDPASAAAVYIGVVLEVLSRYEEFQDAEGLLCEVVQKCAEGLGLCLEGSDDPALRKEMLRALFDIIRYDTDLGGVGLSDDVVEIILKHASPEERRIFASWIQDVSAGDALDDWQHRRYGELLLELEGEDLDDEMFLELCRKMGLLEQLVDRLLSIGRLDEAVAETKWVDDKRLLRLADIFLAHGHRDIAERLVARQIENTGSWFMMDWLKDRYLERGELSGAMELSRQLFQIHPTFSRYQDLRGIARELGTWEHLRSQLHDSLIAGGRHDLLLKIYSDEGEIDRAIESAKMILERRILNTGDADLIESAARAAEDECPDAALEIYRALAEKLIGARGRDNYQRACRYFIRMRDLYRHSGRGEEWERYILDLRERNRRLPALREELKKAGL
ncbi:MAG: SWIM zinc finger family protein [Methanothrix sp.]|nr:SWIM zinc finger family protein [Methanothrix sp.]MCX8206748.1 SWIM zinc finger family protein [Methanothrix sp.]